MADPNAKDGSWNDPNTIDGVPMCQAGSSALHIDEVSTSTASRSPGSQGMEEATAAAQTAQECDCPTPTENYPYGQDTFELIRRIAPFVLTYSAQYRVPPVAVAGSIADEYNTRKGIKAALDWFQDDILLNFMPNFAIQLDAKIGFNTKMLNATKHDIGVGNIKLETAKKIYDSNPNAFKNKGWDYTNIVDYLRSDEGTVQVAALYIREAQDKVGDYIQGYSEADKEAVLVTYYKQGPSYVARYQDKVKSGGGGKIKPGEGCRVCLQRKRILEALSLR